MVICDKFRDIGLSSIQITTICGICKNTKDLSEHLFNFCQGNKTFFFIQIFFCQLHNFKPVGRLHKADAIIRTQV